MPNKAPAQPLSHTPNQHFAIISDVHANARALEAVLQDIQSLKIQYTVCLGDTVGYGYDVVDCVQMVRQSCLCSVLGNHEAMMLFQEEKFLRQIPEEVGQPLLAGREHLDDDSKNWLRDQTLAAALGPMGFSHASRFTPDKFKYVHSCKDAALHFKSSSEEVTFFGHTHVPCLWQETPQAGRASEPTETATAYDPVYQPIHLDRGKRYAINVGSVGKPRDGDPRPCYVIYNPRTRLLVFRRITVPEPFFASP